MDKPAILGGKPIMDELVPIIKPPLHNYSNDEFFGKIQNIIRSGMVTNGQEVKNLEDHLEKYLNVNNAVCLSSCTSGLILTLQLLNARAKEIIIPSLTFLATASAAYWNNCQMNFVDIDPETFNISLDDLSEKISKNTSFIMPVHLYGNPCDIKGLEDLAEDYGATLIFDSAHGIGAEYNHEKVGNFGDAEVFSCSPTKLLITMEGGIVTTNNADLANELKLARNYGNTIDNDCEIPGLNARMTEVNAALGQEILIDVDTIVKNRNEYARIYKEKLSKLPGLKFQKITKRATHAYKDFVIIIDPNEFGMNRDTLQRALEEEKILTKKYFYPPLHKVKAYSSDITLDVSERISENVLALPIYSFMEEDLILNICNAIKRIQNYSDKIKF